MGELSCKKIPSVYDKKELKNDYCVKYLTTNEYLKEVKKVAYDEAVLVLENDYMLGDYWKYKPNTNMQTITRIKDEKLIRKYELIFNEDKQNNTNNQTLSISEIYTQIKDCVVSQDEPIKQIVTGVYKNQKLLQSKISDDKKVKLRENILITGPTGVGKTEIIRQLSKIYKMPMTIENITRYTEAGYVGANIDDMFWHLYDNAGGNLTEAEQGILVIDEIDKIASNETGKSMVSRDGVQRSILKIFEGEEMIIKRKTSNGGEESLRFNPSHLTIICLGAFSNMKQTSSFTIDSFIDYGMMPELMGRFSTFILMNSLIKEDFKNILVSSKISPLKLQEEFLSTMNIKLTWDDDFIDDVAEQAVHLNVGARGLKTIIDKEMNSLFYDVFNHNETEIHLRETKYKTKEKILN